MLVRSRRNTIGIVGNLILTHSEKEQQVAGALEMVTSFHLLDILIEILDPLGQHQILPGADPLSNQTASTTAGAGTGANSSTQVYLPLPPPEFLYDPQASERVVVTLLHLASCEPQSKGGISGLKLHIIDSGLIGPLRHVLHAAIPRVQEHMAANLRHLNTDANGVQDVPRNTESKADDGARSTASTSTARTTDTIIYTDNMIDYICRLLSFLAASNRARPVSPLS